MRTISTLRSSMLALAFAATVTTIGPAVAASDQEAMQSQQAPNSSTGPYDGADFEAAKHAFK